MTYREKKESEKVYTGKVGGFFFFFSLVSVLILATINSILLPFLFTSDSVLPLFYFLLGTTLGAALSYFFVVGHLSVFIHEFKHSLLSHFAGNKAKEMKVRSRSGHFKYEFSKETAHFNAMISLAPYWIPLFSVPTLAIVEILWHHERLIIVALVGVAYGMDLLMNLRDIAPHQTDLTQLRGGYTIGVTYIAAMNVTLGTLFLAWVMGGPRGMWLLIQRIISILSNYLGVSA